MTRFLDPFSEETWKLTYKDFADEDVDSTFKRVAKNIASAEKTEELRKEWQEKFYDLLSDFKGVPGGRIISNAGTKWKNTFHNCFLGARVDFDPDSIQGIMQHLTWQVLTLKSEGGWGENFSYIRPRGSFIHGIGVETPGAVKYMELFDKASDVITAGSGKKSSKKESKGKIRKGALMGTLDVWHPDIEEFITAKQSQGRLEKFNISANCTDEFMNRLIKVLNLEQSGASKEEIEKEDKWDLCFPDTQHTLYKKEWDGDFKSWKDKGYPYIVYKTVSCRYLWNLIMFSTYNRNDPGVLFLDRANFFYPMNYAAKITGTNPCLTADTWIFTDNGPKQIKDLIGIKFSTILSSGKYESTDQGFFSSGEKEIYEIIANNGLKIKGTADHLLLTAKGWKEIQELDSNDQLIIENCSHEWGDSNEFQKGWLLGSLYGDGNFDENSANLDYWGESKYEMQEIAKKYLNDNFNVRSDVGSGNGSPERDRTRLSSKNLGEFAIKLGLKKEHSNSKKYSEDLEKTSSSFQKGFLSGWFDADGSPQGHHVKGVSVRLCSIDLEMLEFAQRSLLRFGILSKIFKNRKEEGYRFLPDGKGGSKEYFCQTVHELVITNKSIQTFYEKIGFKERKKQERLKNYIADYKRKINSDKFFTKINSITKLGIEEVYDCSIPVVNAFNANGLRAHNCGEQVMPSGDICTLGTLNLTQFILEDYSDFDYEKIIKYAKILTRFLDNVNDLSIMPVEDYEKNMKERRRIGCGLMGWGSSLYMLRVRFASKKAEEIRRKLLKEFARAVYEESIDLAKEKGMFPLCEPEKHINAEFLKNLDLSKYYLDDLKVYGIRNSSCLSMQPNGNSSIFVNIVSGGEEPVFLPEYIRTVIVSSTPEHFKNLAPRWEEGEFKETEMFKFTKEGNDVLLRGVDEKTGIVNNPMSRGPKNQPFPANSLP
jgi:ribonucleoside-diphosphate reductase alpha chain